MAQEGIFGSIRKNKDEYIKKFKELYDLGFNDSEIAKELRVNNVTVRNWRIKLDLPSNFSYTRKFDIEKFMELYNEGLNYVEIAKSLDISSSAAQEYGQSLGLESNVFKYPNYEFTEEEFQVFLGTIYGDSYIRIPSDSRNASGHFAHSLAQQNYCIWKYEKLKRFCSEPKFVSEVDKRSGKTYYAVDVRIKAHPLFTELYPSLYKDKIKYINKALFEKIEPLGLAVLFMDDGYYDNGSYSIATNCFSDEDISIIQQILQEKFNLTFTKHSNNSIRLRKFCVEVFLNLITEYIHPDCLYKLHTGEP